MKCIIASEKPWNRHLLDDLNQEMDVEFQLISKNEDFTFDKVSKIAPYYIFLPHWSYFIPKKIYKNFECIVFHMTDLPFGRGGSPLQNLIERGIHHTKISALRVEEKLDAGPIYLKHDLCLFGTAEEIFIRASKIISEMIGIIITKTPTPTPQVGDVTLFQRRAPSQSNITDLSTFEQIFDYIRMLDCDGYPKAFLETGKFRFEFSRPSLKTDCIMADVKIMLKKKTIDKILFRVDGYQNIGLGHIIRCIALANMVRDKFQITFACQERDNEVLKMIYDERFNLIKLPIESHYEKDAEILIRYLDKKAILVLDGYHFKEEYQLIVKPHCQKLICIDDIHNYHFYADVIINHNEQTKNVNYSCEPFTQLYLGGKYALLRSPFLKNKKLKRDFEKSIKNILICMGGADPSNQTLRIVKALDLIDLNLIVNVVIGIANPNYHTISKWIGKNSKLKINLLSNLNASEMCKQLILNDFLFAQASTIAWEACCIGIPMIVGITADNQTGIAEILGNKQAALNLKWYKDISIIKIKEKFLRLINDKYLLKQFITNQKNIIDGNSKLRYQKIFAEL